MTTSPSFSALVGRAQDQARIAREFREQYHPCNTGLHVVGIDDDNPALLHGPHFTIENVRARDEAHARKMFEAARAECAATPGDEPCDLLVDLRVDGDHIDEFPMMRQMLDRLKALTQEPR
jgi:hypothetical protein